MNKMKTDVDSIIKKYNNDKTRLMDILIDTQEKEGYIPEEAVATIAEILDLSR